MIQTFTAITTSGAYQAATEADALRLADAAAGGPVRIVRPHPVTVAWGENWTASPDRVHFTPTLTDETFFTRDELQDYVDGVAQAYFGAHP